MLGRTHRYVGLLAASASFIPIKNICLSGHGCSWPLSDLASYQAHFIKSFISLGDNHKEYLTGYLLLYFFFALVGAMIPDKDLALARFYGDRKDEKFRYHRQWTHSILLWVALTAFTYYLFYNNYMPILWVSLMGFCIGGLSHLVADMLSGSVPWGFYGKYYDRFSRFGITIFLPKSMHGIFTKKIPAFIEKYSFILLIVTVVTGAYTIYSYKFDFVFFSILK